MRLEDLMREKGYSFTELSELSGVARSSIEKIVYGKAKRPYPKTMRLIANALEKNINDIDEFREVNEAFRKKENRQSSDLVVLAV